MNDTGSFFSDREIEFPYDLNILLIDYPDSFEVEKLLSQSCVKPLLLIKLGLGKILRIEIFFFHYNWL